MWTSSNSNVALVDSNGVVTGVGPGKATLTVVRNVGVDLTLTADVTVPSVSSPLRFQQVVAGDVFTCGRTSSETYCWGKNTLGTTAAIDRCSKYTDYSGAGRVYYVRTTFECAMEPVRVDAPVPFASISAQGAIACGVSTDGRAYCWGDGMAPSAFPGSSVPTLVSNSPRFANFVGQCGVTTTNEGWCWGPIALRGTAEASGTVSQVAGGAVWRRIDVAGADYRCGVEVDGTFACWGANAKGQLGTGDSVASVVPVPIKSTERFRVGIGGGGGLRKTCALSVTGVVYCWGYDSPTPISIAAAEPITSLSGDAWSGFCGLTSAGLMYCGAGFAPNMNAVQPAMRFTSDAANGAVQHRCGLAVDTLLYCWGLNDYGELGVGHQQSLQTPTRVAGQ